MTTTNTSTTDTQPTPLAGYDPDSCTYDIFDEFGNWLGFISADEIVDLGDQRDPGAIIEASCKDARETDLDLTKYREMFPEVKLIELHTLC